MNNCDTYARGGRRDRSAFPDEANCLVVTAAVGGKGSRMRRQETIIKFNYIISGPNPMAKSSSPSRALLDDGTALRPGTLVFMVLASRAMGSGERELRQHVVNNTFYQTPYS